MTSADGVTWTELDDRILDRKHIRSIAFGNGKFVAVGDEAKMATSTDGRTWTAVTDSTFYTAPVPGRFDTNGIRDIAYGNGKFVAVGEGRKIATSTNGTTWTAVPVSVENFIDFEGIAYGGNKFVVAGRDDDYNPYIAYSENGTSWTNVKINSSSTGYTFKPGYGYTLFYIAYGNKKFITGGGATTS